MTGARAPDPGRARTPRGPRRAAACVALALTVLLSPRPAAAAASLPPDSIPPAAEPGYLVRTIDPVFGTVLTRITNDTGQPTDPVPGVWGADARHVYGTQ